METNDISKTFGILSFGDAAMKERLSPATYASIRKTIDEGRALEAAIADEVANAMKDWAIEHGATHFTHWFGPHTDITAEKHDSFLNITPDGQAIMEFSGKMLIRGEADASSFPSGGLRDTFEARGYTAWDCTSPAFVKDGTLYIPTAFCSYNGQSLDKKTPLLRSMETLNVHALRVLRALGNTESKKVIATCGPEQEYFLIDRSFYEQRRDLMLCGRTLLGARPAKGQEMDDHYYGRLKLRVTAFMKELDEQLWKLGVPSKTKHNEAAPAQHELAPIFATANIACDQNQLIMALMRQVAKKHGLACLLHEKPFKGVNGSGKHNNWSLCTDDGQVLLDPGSTPYENTRFLVFLAATVKAVDDYADLLRFSISVPGNDLRLGGNEAPPAIVSIFLGDELSGVVDSLITGQPYAQPDGQSLQIGVNSLPPLPRDNTDRNRTSPFAFTGNKFEYRSCGSSASVADSCTVLNAIVADTLREFADRLENGEDATALITETLKAHERVIFNGNGYTEEWVRIAEKRGLPNYRCAVDVLPVILAEKNVRMLERTGVFTEQECRARYEIELEKYAKTINIEALTMAEMVRHSILPHAMESCGTLAEKCLHVEQITGENLTYRNTVQMLAQTIDCIQEKLAALENATDKAAAMTDRYEQAHAYHETVLPAMEELREPCDFLEEHLDERDWPLPSYFDMMFRL